MDILKLFKFASAYVTKRTLLEDTRLGRFNCQYSDNNLQFL
jgi:hypothetical protein